MYTVSRSFRGHEWVAPPQGTSGASGVQRGQIQFKNEIGRTRGSLFRLRNQRPTPRPRRHGHLPHRVPVDVARAFLATKKHGRDPGERTTRRLAPLVAGRGRPWSPCHFPRTLGRRQYRQGRRPVPALGAIHQPAAGRQRHCGETHQHDQTLRGAAAVAAEAVTSGCPHL